MKLAIIGSGYVGLVTGACLSDFGHDVTCIDKDHKKISALKRGIIPIYEPGLESLVLKNIKSQRLSFTTNIKTAVKKCDVVFIAVGTPANENGGGADIGGSAHTHPSVRTSGNSTAHSTSLMTYPMRKIWRPRMRTDILAIAA